MLLQFGLDTEWWADSMECYTCLRNIQDLLSDGKNHLVKGGSECHSTDQLYRLEQWVEYHPISAKDLSRLHQCGPKVLPGIFLGYALYAGGIWKGDIYDCGHCRIGGDGRV